MAVPQQPPDYIVSGGLQMNAKEFLFGRTRGQVSKTGIYKGSTQEWLPIAEVQDGIVITKDGRYVKIIEILPVNFYLKSYMEQQNIIISFAQYLKIAPDNIQIRICTQKADIGAYESRMWAFYENEENEKCREMIADNIDMVRYLAANETVTHRFFIIIQLEPGMKPRSFEARDIAARLYEEAQTARKYLDFCGLEVIEWDDPDEALISLLFGLINKKSASNIKMPGGVTDMISDVIGEEAHEG
jgi:hypothetical protein